MTAAGRSRFRHQQTVWVSHPRTATVCPLRSLERLEERCTPIVGQYVDPNGVNEFLAARTVRPLEGYDGVVRLERSAARNSYYATGSLFALNEGQSRGHHLLTAAHVVFPPYGPIVLADFQLARANGRAVDVPVDLRPGAPYQVPHPDYSGAPTAWDIAVIRLTDPFGPADPARLLVAPAGAERYTLAAPLPAGSPPTPAPEKGQVVTVVGYGGTGEGLTGAKVYDRRKRLGVNRLEADEADFVAIGDKTRQANIFFDFDSGPAVGGDAHDSLQKLLGPDFKDHGIAGGLGVGKSVDIGTAPGDSGGPFFVGPTIQAVVSDGYRPGYTHTKWGDVTVGTLVSRTRSFIDEVAIGKGNYEVVLDMAYQIYGRDTPGEKIDITVWQDGNDLVIDVQGPDRNLPGAGRYNGTY